MTVTAIAFRLSDLDGRVIGFGLLCPEVRYASTWWLGAPRPHRQHAMIETWQRIDQEVRDRLPATPLPATSAIAQLLASMDHAASVQYLDAVTSEIARFELVAPALDARLQQLVLEGSPRP
jgi:hypothetical protein